MATIAVDMKGHALYLGEVRIPVEFLVNHRSILWDDRAQEVVVYHLELDTRDVLMANGATAESYRNDGNRRLFQNADSGWDLPPKPPCALVLTGGRCGVASVAGSTDCQTDDHGCLVCSECLYREDDERFDFR
jgi:hypothetical protein